MIKSICLSKGLRTLAISAIMAAPMALIATPALAGTSGTTSPVTDTFQVTATVAKSCSVSAGNALAFGTYDPLAAISATNGTGSTTFTVACSNGTPYSIGLTYGGTGTKTDRVMAQTGGGTGTLDYNLYTDNGYTNVWYDGTDGCSTVPNTSANCAHGTGAGKTPTTYTVYGQIDQTASPNPPQGSYLDTITVQVYF